MSTRSEESDASDRLDNVHEYIRDRKVHLLHTALEEDSSVLRKADADGRTPLMWALSESQDPEIVSEVLLAARKLGSRFDVDAADAAGFTALHIAASLGSEFVELLLPFDPAINAPTNNRQTPLFLAVSKNQIAAARVLLEHKASVGAKDSRQVTSLQRAAAMGSVELVELLLSYRAPVNATDAYGWTALHHAYAEERVSVAAVLLKHGANPAAQNSDEETPAQLAPGRFDAEVKKELAE